MSPIVHSTNNILSSRDFMAPSNEWTEEGEFILRGHTVLLDNPSVVVPLDLMPAFASGGVLQGQDIGFRVSLNRATNDLLADYIDIGKAEDFNPTSSTRRTTHSLKTSSTTTCVTYTQWSVEEYCSVIQLHLAIQNFLHVPFGSTFNSTRFCGVMFNRDAGFLPKDPVWDNQQHATLSGFPTVLLDNCRTKAQRLLTSSRRQHGTAQCRGARRQGNVPVQHHREEHLLVDGVQARRGDENSVTFDLRDKEKLRSSETTTS